MIRISDAEFDRVAEEALAGIPREFARYLENVVVEVRALPDRKLMAEEDVPEDALGVYIGLPLEEQGPAALNMLPDRILIFRENLCEMCQSREELVDEIRVTILHEVGHHFGLDEDRLGELGYG